MGAIITQKQNNKPWTLTWKASGRYPMVADRIYATLADAQAYVDDLTATASATPGLVLSVVNDGKNNGIYYVQSIAQAATETTEFVPGVLVAAGAGAGSEAVETFTVGEDGKIVEAENIGQILYVTTGTDNYPAGPYIVTGVGAVAKLGTTTATGDIAGDVENLKGRMSTAEGEIDALQTAVGDANSGLVKGLADANGAIDAVEGRMDTAEGEIDALQGVVGDADSGLVKNVAALQTLTGEHSGTLTSYGSRISANETAVAELRGAVAGGVHFRGVKNELPWNGYVAVFDEEDYTNSEYAEEFGSYKAYLDNALDGYNVGDIIIVAPTNTAEGSDQTDTSLEPTKEYILVSEPRAEFDPKKAYRWEDLGTCSVSDQKIAEVEKNFNDHVTAMDTAWSEHLEEADGKYATITNLQAAEKALEDHVTAMVPTVEAAADYVANKSTFALAANVVANDTFNQHVTAADTRMDGIDAAILAVPVKSVTTDSVLKLSEAGALSVDMSNFVTKDGNKVLSDENYSAAEKSKLEGIAAGAQVNVIETIKVNGSDLAVEGKAVNIDLVNHLAGKLSINGQVLAEAEDNGVLAAVVDASDIHLGAAIGDHAAADTTVQSMLSTVYDIANSKIGSIHLAAGATSNVLALSKTNIANDTIELKIASGSAITATANGLDLVWTEL
jgi:hypothetical protein